MDSEATNTTILENKDSGGPQKAFVKRENASPEIKTAIDQEHLLVNKNESSSANSSRFWPSLWKNGPRRSAFQPYKPTREISIPRPVEPRPASTTVMTNLQRGNIQAETTPTETDLSWFTLAGRGDITAEDLKQMLDQGFGYNGDLVKQLLKHPGYEYDFDIVSISPNAVLLLQCKDCTEVATLLSCGEPDSCRRDIDSVDEEGLSALMWAAYHGQIHSVQILLEAGQVEVDREGMWGETAIMLAASGGHLEIVRLLISVGADVNHQDHNGETALMCAVHGDHPHTVSELLSNGADLSLCNYGNCAAYDVAVDQKAHRSKVVLEKYILSLLTTS